MKQILQNETLNLVRAFELEDGYFVQTIVRITFHNFRSFIRGWLIPPREMWYIFAALNALFLSFMAYSIYAGDAPTSWRETLITIAVIAGIILLFCLFKHIKEAPRPTQNFPIGQTVSFSKFNLAEHNSYLSATLRKSEIIFTVGQVFFGRCVYDPNGRFLFEDDTLKYMAGIGGATPQLAFPLLQRMAPSNAGAGASKYADTSAELYAFVATLNHVHDLLSKSAPERTPAPAVETKVEPDGSFNPMD